LRQGWRAGRFEERCDEIQHVEAAADGPNAPLLLQLALDGRVVADRLVCATGFEPDARAHPLVRRLAKEYGVAADDGILRVADDFTLPPLSDDRSRFAVVGALARWTLPVADTFFGMKYAARRIAPYMQA
jgi:hypothetical protein